MEEEVCVSSQTIDENINNEKISLKKRIRDLETAVETKITKLQEELIELKNKESVCNYNFSDLLETFKNDVKLKIEETNQFLINQIEQQNKKHLKLLNILMSLKLEYSSLSKSVSLLQERIQILEEDIGE